MATKYPGGIGGRQQVPIQGTEPTCAECGEPMAWGAPTILHRGQRMHGRCSADLRKIDSYLRGGSAEAVLAICDRMAMASGRLAEL